MNESEKSHNEINQGHEILISNTFYNFLNNFGIYFFSLFSSVLIARILTSEIWGFLILSLSYINIIILISKFFPPSLSISVNYYLPRYYALNSKSELKSFMKKSLLFKLLILIIFFIISVLIFWIFGTFFKGNLNEYSILLFILSPLIVVNGLYAIIESIFRSFNNFKLIFLLLLVKYSIYLTSLLMFVFFQLLMVEYIALFYFISSLIPFILSLIFIRKLFIKLNNDDPKEISFKNFLEKTTRYGAPLSLGVIFSSLWKEFEIQTIGIFETSEWVTGFSISKNFSSVPQFTAQSTAKPLITSFSELNAKSQKDKITSIYNISLKYSLLILFFLTGIFFFISEFFLRSIYGIDYVKFTILLKLYLISITFNPLGAIFKSLLLSTHKVKYLPLIDLLNIFILIPCFLIGLIFFNIYGALIGIIISHFIIFLINIILSFKIGNINMQIKNLISQYSSFYIPLIITVILNILFLNNWTKMILDFLGLSLFFGIEFLSLLFFLVMMILLNIYLEIIKEKDLNILLKYFNKNKISHKIIRRLTKYLKVFIS